MRFAARVLRWGVSRNGVRWGSALGPALVAAIADVPVRCYREGARLRHPRERGDLRGIIGHVKASAATGAELLADLEIFDERFASGFLALEHDRLLPRAIGISLLADVLYQPTVELGNEVRRVTQVRSVLALDLVSDPSADGCMLFSMRGQHIAAGHGVGAQPGTGLAESSSGPGMARFLFDVNGGS